MAFTETPEEKVKRKAWEQANLDTAKAKEVKADAEAARKFEETTNVDTSKNTNPMGDTYKKGGKVKSPTMTYETYTKTGKPAGMKTVKVSDASKRADGCCVKGKTKGKYL